MLCLTSTSFLQFVLYEFLLCRVEPSGEQQVPYVRCPQLGQIEREPDGRSAAVLEDGES